MDKILIRFLIICIQTKLFHGKTTINAVANEYFINVIINDVTPTNTIEGENLIWCSKSCLETDNCFSFFYNSITTICKLFDVDFTEPAQGVSEEGWNYYTAMKDCKINGKECPVSNGYIFSQKVCMCYKYFPIQSVFANADRYCKETEDGQLVKIDRMLKQIELAKFIETVNAPHRTENNVIIQGTRIEGTSKWIFDNGREMSFLPWNRNMSQPDMRAGEIVIVATYWAGSPWHDGKLSQSFRFMCEKVL